MNFCIGQEHLHLKLLTHCLGFTHVVCRMMLQDLRLLKVNCTQLILVCSVRYFAPTVRIDASYHR